MELLRSQLWHISKDKPIRAQQMAEGGSSILDKFRQKGYLDFNELF